LLRISWAFGGREILASGGETYLYSASNARYRGTPIRPSDSARHAIRLNARVPESNPVRAERARKLP